MKQLCLCLLMCVPWSLAPASESTPEAVEPFAQNVIFILADIVA